MIFLSSFGFELCGCACCLLHSASRSQVDKNYEISLYGAVNAIVSVFASTVGSMACVHLEVLGDSSRFTKSDFGERGCGQAQARRSCVETSKPGFQHACLLNESVANGRAVVTLWPMTKTLTCSLTCPMYKRYSWPLLSEGPTSPWL